MFVGRVEELAQLNSFYDADSFSVAAVYGSIGMGKTTLLKRFIEDKDNSFFYTCYETTGRHQLMLMSESLGLGSFQTANELCSAITEQAKIGKVLIVLDNYTNLVRADADIDDVLYHYALSEWAKLPIKIVFAGDAFVLMDKYIFGKKAQWKDLVSTKIEVGPFGYYDSCKFFDGATKEDTVFLYGITGGIAHNLVRVTSDIRESTIRLFLDNENSVGLNPERVMATELRELAYYNFMLSTLAEGYNRVNQISAKVDKPKDVVVPYLNSLMNIGIVTKETAITEVTNRKKTRYSIVNTSTLFWYKYIAVNTNLYANNEVDKLWNIILENKKEFLNTVFIKICAENLKRRSDEATVPFTVEQIGNWWVNDEEAGTTEGFDLVSLGNCNGRNATAFCQCYYNDAPIEIAQLKALIEKTKQLKRQGDVFYLVFSKSGFNENAITVSSAVKNIMLISLDEMI